MMTNSLLLIIASALTLVVTAQSVSAQQQPASPPATGSPAPDVRPMPGTPGWGPGMMMGPGMMGRGGFGHMCNPRAAGLAEWRFDRIERAVRPTDAQRKALDDLKAASAKAAETIVDACPRDIPRASTERLALMEKRMEAMLQAIKTVRPAFDAFYGSLSDKQKTRLDATGPRRWGWHRWRWSGLNTP